MQWLLSGGGTGYTDDVGTYSIDSVQNVHTFSWIKEELVAKGLTGPVAPAKLNRAAAFSAFTRGDVGMLVGHPTLMQQAASKGVKFGMVPMPGIDGRAKATMGVADWMMAFKKNGNAEQVGDFLDFVYQDKNVLAFSHKYDLLPVTASASEAMAVDKDDKDLEPFLAQLPSSQLYPVGKTSWAGVSADVKSSIAKAVSPAATRPRCSARSRPARPWRTAGRASPPGRTRVRGHDEGHGPLSVVGVTVLSMEELPAREQRVLALERRGFAGPGAKERAIREQLGLAPVRYYQLLNALLDDPRALAHDPVTVNRLRRVREARRSER